MVCITRSIVKGIMLFLVLIPFNCGMPASESISMDLDLQESYAFENNDGYKPIKYLFIHCSASSSRARLRGKDIMKIAKQRGFQRPPYHFFLPRSGEVDTLCRLNGDQIISPEELCWGVAGVNSFSIHICLESCFVDYPESKIDSRNYIQTVNLERLIRYYKAQVPGIIVQGHRDYPGVRKLCPGFNAKSEYSTL